MNKAQQLVLGRREIDRQKAEIKEVALTLLRHIHPAEMPKEVQRQVCLHRGHLFWELCSYPDAPMSLSCYSSGPTHDPVRVFHCTSKGSDTEPSAPYIRNIHSNLDLLMQKMFKEFPSLESSLKPYFQAAESAQK